MNESFLLVDESKHVRFEGRPKNTCRHLHVPDPLSSAAEFTAERRSKQLAPLISRVFERAELNIANYRVKPLQRRLSACLRALHADSEPHACLILEKRPDLLSTAVNTLLLGVTEFFRDPAVFETLQTCILPQLACLGRPLRVWSAGCSNGSELYSLAILLDKAGLLENSFLLGSDCRSAAIADARTPLYDSRELRNVELSDRRRYFNEIGCFWQPVDFLRRNVRWKVADLIHRIEDGPWSFPEE
jgi:chemotaxis methyl-accepting protein methylase